MDSATDLEITTVKCFKGDLPRVKRLGERLETLERAGFANQHTISRALDALDRETAAADAAKAQATDPAP